MSLQLQPRAAIKRSAAQIKQDITMKSTTVQNGLVRRQAVKDSSVIILLLLVIGIILWVHFTVPILAISILENSKTMILKIGITVASTIITGIVSARIQHGLIRCLESKLQDSELALTLEEIGRMGALMKLDKRWRWALQIDSFREKFRNYGVCSAFLLCSLNTTSIASLLGPTLTTKAVYYDARISDTGFGAYSLDLNRSCVSFCQATCNFVTRSSAVWPQKNGSMTMVNTDGTCPTTFLAQLVPGINSENPNDYVYTQSRIAVHRSAMGTPESIFHGTAFGNLSSFYGQAFVRTTQCVPIMTSNPVHCVKDGNTTVVPNGPNTLPDSITLTVTGLPIAVYNNKNWNNGNRGLVKTDNYPSRRANTDSVMGNELFTVDWKEPPSE
ncbi:hypothetical protein SUNI508_10338 [Seiridium unicorne]|uniref:Uncharacterized protein n=1 Tax=Seiridium unicorne TaxID=138068 RepID=A0ABR2ULY0_9PEZI